jgi:hypothetical protein
MLSGPIAIALTSSLAQQYTEDRPVLRALRRIIAMVFATMGTFIAIQLLYETTPLAPKLMAIAAIAGAIYALRREVKYAKSR